VYAVGQHAERDRFTGIVPNENVDHSRIVGIETAI
jgi:hypothetical protein